MEDLPVEVVVTVEQPWLKVRLNLKLSKYLMAAVALLETNDLESEVESIDLDLAIDHLANLLDHLVATMIDRLTMSRSTMLDHCRYPP